MSGDLVYDRVAMKNRASLVFLALGLVLFASVACSLFTARRLEFLPDKLPQGQVGTAYETEIRISGNRTPAGDMFVSEGSLPPGLALTFMKGEDRARITGVPSGPGTFAFKIYVWCYGTQVGGQTGEETYSLVVSP